MWEAFRYLFLTPSWGSKRRAAQRTLAHQMARCHRLPGNQPPKTLQVHPGGMQPALLVEAQQEADECRGVEAGEGGDV